MGKKRKASVVYGSLFKPQTSNCLFSNNSQDHLNDELSGQKFIMMLRNPDTGLAGK